jgi:L-alanine-DL-glutamate epimerase-like enolase superfamily enzyme
MIERLRNDVYAFVQPDASVVGGISAVMEVFTAARAHGTGVVVHAWGGAAAIMASYHAAFAAGGEPVEYPMLDFPLGTEMTGDLGLIEGGRLLRPTAAGLGLTLTPQMEARYPFDPSAVYSCVLHDWGPPPDSYWSA